MHVARQRLVDLPLAARPHLLEPRIRLAAQRVLAAVGQVAPRAVGEGGVDEDERRPGVRAPEGGDRPLEARGRVVRGEPVRGRRA